MIVAGKFDGDENDALMCAQHDVYGASLRIIVEECFRIRKRSMAVMGTSKDVLLPESFTGITFDHRNFQEVHDTLAAYWRKQSGKAMPQLPFNDQNKNHIAERHGWLLSEVRSWFYVKPELIAYVTKILAAQKNPKVAKGVETGLVAILQEKYALGK